MHSLIVQGSLRPHARVRPLGIDRGHGQHRKRPGGPRLADKRVDGAHGCAGRVAQARGEHERLQHRQLRACSCSQAAAQSVLFFVQHQQCEQLFTCDRCSLVTEHSVHKRTKNEHPDRTKPPALHVYIVRHMLHLPADTPWKDRERRACTMGEWMSVCSTYPITRANVCCSFGKPPTRMSPVMVPAARPCQCAPLSAVPS